MKKVATLSDAPIRTAAEESRLAQQLLEFRPGSRVRNVGGSKSSASGLQNPVAQAIQPFNIVGIRTDHDGNSVSLSGGTVGIIQIQSCRIRIELQHFVMAFGRSKDRIDVQLV